MIRLENRSTGEVYEGKELELFIDDDTLIGEVYIDGDLIFQTFDVHNEEQLDRSLKTEFKFLNETYDMFSDFIG